MVLVKINFTESCMLNWIYFLIRYLVYGQLFFIVINQPIFIYDNLEYKALLYRIYIPKSLILLCYFNAFYHDISAYIFKIVYRFDDNFSCSELI